MTAPDDAEKRNPAEPAVAPEDTLPEVEDAARQEAEYPADESDEA
jgi:hypothetical protein